jgi:N-acetylmuramoyl-L-alanine amidase
MRKIFISAGHSNKSGKDRGAAGNGFIEGELTVELRDLITKELNKFGIKPITDCNSTVLSESIAFFRNLTSSTCIVLDLHWNAATATATGTETLIPSEYTKFELDLAEAISKVTADVLEIPLRGVTAGKRGVKTEASSHHGRLGWMRLTGENILTETCFISNPNDMRKYQERKERLAKEIAKVLFDFAKDGKLTQSTTVSVNTPINTTVNHTVKAGENLTVISRQHNTTIADIRRLNNLTTDNIRVGQTLRVK